MDLSNPEKTVPQLLARLVTETDRLKELTEDINAHAITPQAKAALERIGNEVNIVLQILSVSIEPLYNLYETDLGMMNSKMLREATSNAPGPGFDPSVPLKTEEYDENALWNEVGSTNTRE